MRAHDIVLLVLLLADFGQPLSPQESVIDVAYSDAVYRCPTQLYFNLLCCPLSPFQPTLDGVGANLALILLFVMGALAIPLAAVERKCSPHYRAAIDLAYHSMASFPPLLKKGLSLLLILYADRVVGMLLIMSGDVEQNPGPTNLDMEKTVRRDWQRNQVWINQDCFQQCWHKIWRWVDVDSLTGQLMKHRFLSDKEQDFYWIDPHKRWSPHQRADNLLYTLAPKVGPYGHYLLYMCIRDCDGNPLGHGDAVKELVAYSKQANLHPPWLTDSGGPSSDDDSTSSESGYGTEPSPSSSPGSSSPLSSPLSSLSLLSSPEYSFNPEVRTPLFRDVVGVIVTARVDWFSLGVHLDVPSAKLHEIKLDYQGEVELMTETIDYCFHNDINFSWGTLASALKEKGHTGIAEALMRMTPTSQASELEQVEARAKEADEERKQESDDGTCSMVTSSTMDVHDPVQPKTCTLSSLPYVDYVKTFHDLVADKWDVLDYVADAVAKVRSKEDSGENILGVALSMKAVMVSEVKEVRPCLAILVKSKEGTDRLLKPLCESIVAAFNSRTHDYISETGTTEEPHWLRFVEYSAGDEIVDKADFEADPQPSKTVPLQSITPGIQICWRMSGCKGTLGMFFACTIFREQERVFGFHVGITSLHVLLPPKPHIDVVVKLKKLIQHKLYEPYKMQKGSDLYSPEGPDKNDSCDGSAAMTMFPRHCMDELWPHRQTPVETHEGHPHRTTVGCFCSGVYGELRPNESSNHEETLYTVVMPPNRLEYCSSIPSGATPEARPEAIVDMAGIQCMLKLDGSQGGGGSCSFKDLGIDSITRWELLRENSVHEDLFGKKLKDLYVYTYNINEGDAPIKCERSALIDVTGKIKLYTESTSRTQLGVHLLMSIDETSTNSRDFCNDGDSGSPLYFKTADNGALLVGICRGEFWSGRNIGKYTGCYLYPAMEIIAEQVFDLVHLKEHPESYRRNREKSKEEEKIRLGALGVKDLKTTWHDKGVSLCLEPCLDQCGFTMATPPATHGEM